MYIEVFIDAPKDLCEFLPNIHILYFVWSLIWVIHVECADGGAGVPVALPVWATAVRFYGSVLHTYLVRRRAQH